MHTPEVKRPKFVASLTFRGFDMSPEEVQNLVGKTASLAVARGSTRFPGSSPFNRSAVSWKLNFADSSRLDEMIPALIQSLGGTESLLAAKAAVTPEFLEVDVSMWIIDSEEQEGGFLELETLEMLSELGATLSFGFYSRSDA